MAKVKKRTWTNKAGKHEAWQIDFTDRHGKRHREQFTLKRDAENRLGELQGSTRAGTYRPLADAKRVNDACQAFCDYMSGRHARGENVALTYLKAVKQHCQNWIDPTGLYVDFVPLKEGDTRKDVIGFKSGIGAIKLADLTAARVGKWRDDMRLHGAGVVTSRRALGTLSRVLKHGVETDMTAMNVARGIRVIGTRDEGSKKVRPPSKADISALLATADEQTRLMVQFAAATGLRASEQWALKWKHLDLDRRIISVEQRVDAFGGIDTTKSAAGTRTVPAGKSLASSLACFRDASIFNDDADFVFVNTAGGLIRHTNHTKRTWNPLVKKAGIEHIGWHALRHFAVSTWIESGLSPKTVQTLAGHATYAITMDRYGHLFPSDDHAATFDKLAEALS